MWSVHFPPFTSIGEKKFLAHDRILKELHVARWHRVFQLTAIPNGLFSINYRCTVSRAKYVNNISQLLRALYCYLSDI